MTGKWVESSDFCNHFHGILVYLIENRSKSNIVFKNFKLHNYK